MEQVLETGERAPHFSLFAAGSARHVSLRAEAGRRVVPVFHLQGTAPTAREINRAVRARRPEPEDVLVASVIDLSIVPRLLDIRQPDTQPGLRQGHGRISP